MTHDANMNDATMLGTYTLDGDVPVEPEIVLANCTDTDQLGQLVSLFQGNPDIRFFLVENGDTETIDLNANFYFLKDSGNWALANHDTMVDVRFDNADFNPAGNEETFSLIQSDHGTWSISIDDTVAFADLPPSDQLLVDMPQDDIFSGGTDAHPTDTDSFFIDPSALGQGENAIEITNFHLGQDTLELPEGMSVRDIFVDADHTTVHIGQTDTPTSDDIIVKLMGVSQPALSSQDYAIDNDSTSDDLISHLINSGMKMD